jgi:hypothetical protein
VIEFNDITGHPLAIELEKRITCILRFMALFRYSKFSLYQAQLWIIRDLLSLEKSLKDCRISISDFRAKASSIAIETRTLGKSLDSNQKREVELLFKDAEEYSIAVQILRYGRWMYRYVGDGIAWRAFGYNRKVIRALGDKEPVPFISKKEGIDKEILFFKAIRRLGRQWFPLMHDLTNCVRTADISIFKKGKLYEIKELKIRKLPDNIAQYTRTHRRVWPRENRQEQHLRNILEFFITNDLGKLHPEWSGGIAIHASTQERHNFLALSRTIQQARRQGFGISQIDQGILYIALDERRMPMDDAIKKAQKEYPKIFETLFTFRSINPRLEHYHNILPITAMNLPVGDVIDIIFGHIGLLCVLNYALIEKYCRENGIPITFLHDHPKTISITIGSAPPYSYVNEGLWIRLLLEALSLDSFIDLIKVIIDKYKNSNIETG